VVDGRQPNYSEGMSITELADIVLDNGDTPRSIWTAAGRAFVIEGESGQPVVLNSPIDQRIRDVKGRSPITWAYSSPIASEKPGNAMNPSELPIGNAGRL
jgi:hypothetical protein